MLRCYTGTHEEKDIIMRNYIRNDWLTGSKKMSICFQLNFIYLPTKTIRTFSTKNLWKSLRILLEYLERGILRWLPRWTASCYKCLISREDCELIFIFSSEWFHFGN